MPHRPRPPRTTVTQQDVARRAGVSRATVSYILTGSPAAARISDEVAARVRAAAVDLGYAPNYAARTLASGQTHTIGLAVGTMPQGLWPFWARIAEGAEAQALAAGYSVLLLNRDTLASPDDLLRVCHGRIDALLVHRDFWEGQDVALRRLPWPVVVVQPAAPSRLPFVSLDPEPGITAAVRHVAQFGHARIAWLGPPQPVPQQRDVLVRKAARAFGLACDLFYTSEPELLHSEPADRIIAHWRAQLEPLLVRALRASALFCWNDRMALGLYSLLATRGLRVPHDVSVIGFDDWEAPLALPPLSTVSHELQALGKSAVRLTLRLIAAAPRARATQPPAHIRVPARFIRRASTGPAARLV